MDRNGYSAYGARSNFLCWVPRRLQNSSQLCHSNERWKCPRTQEDESVTDWKPDFKQGGRLMKVSETEKLKNQPFPPTITTSDKTWATEGAPDARSVGYASVVQEQLEEGKTNPAVYLMRKGGLSRAQADEIIKACGGAKSPWEKFKTFGRNLIGI